MDIIKMRILIYSNIHLCLSIQLLQKKWISLKEVFPMVKEFYYHKIKGNTREMNTINEMIPLTRFKFNQIKIINFNNLL